jgi:hypothetical protein
MVWTPLILDTFTFDEARLETPEAFGDMGGTQSLEQHDFPGGTRTQKAYGYFPAMQKWRAKFHGMDASDRAEGVKRILAAGREVKLQYATRAWLGRVAKFSPTAKHSWLYEYELEFWPRLDYGSPGPTSPPVTDLGTQLALHILSLQSLLTYGLSGNLLFQTIAAEIGGPIGLLISQVLDSVAAAGGVIGNITAPNQQAIYQSSLNALAACQPYQVSGDPTQSSPASDAAARIQAIQTIMTAAQPPVAVLQTINPNLVVLAATYYGQAELWRSIASANGLADSQPIGTFSLIIPQAP